jgi:hypothetical protein
MQTPHYNLQVLNEDLRILFALEPAWTVSINGSEFVPASAAEIEIHDSTLRFKRQNRKILGIDWLRPNVPRIRTHADVLTFYPGGVLPDKIETRRRRRVFQTLLARALGVHFETRTPMKQSLGRSGIYPRFILGNRAVIAVDSDESAPVIGSVMRAAVAWSRQTDRRISVVVPAERSRTIVTRLHSMPSLSSEFEWFQWNGKTIEPLAMSLPDCETHVHEYRVPNVADEVSRICAIAPDLLQAVPDIPGNAVSIRMRGLEVAHITETGTTYPMGEPLHALIETLAKERRYSSRHPLAHAYEERWLESNLIRQAGDLFPVLPEWIYPQVPSFVGEDRSIIDLLAITSTGRLVVIEVKATADPDLPFQAFDYWLAVERHRKAGDFQAKGYFHGLDIRDEPALLLVVAPLLAFHRSLDGLLELMPRNLPFTQIGINQSWKREIKILRRKGTLG